MKNAKLVLFIVLSSVSLLSLTGCLESDQEKENHAREQRERESLKNVVVDPIPSMRPNK